MNIDIISDIHEKPSPPISSKTNWYCGYKARLILEIVSIYFLYTTIIIHMVVLEWGHGSLQMGGNPIMKMGHVLTGYCKITKLQKAPPILGWKINSGWKIYHH